MKKTVYVLVCLMMLGACTKKEIQYQMFAVTKQDLSRNVEANGDIETNTTVDILTPVSGRLEQLFIKEGDKVRLQQKLGMISSDTRSTILDLVAGQGKDETKYWKEQLLLTPIFAPVAGKVIALKAEVGNKVAGSIGQVSTGEIIRANVDEADLPSIKIGQKVNIRFDINSKATLEGSLKRISQTSKLVNNVNVYQVEVNFPPEEERTKFPFKIQLGMSVTLNFPIDEIKDALALPINSVEGKSMTTVKLLKVDGTKIDVKLGDTYGDLVQVLSGLQEGEKIKIPVFNTQKAKVRKSPLMFKKD